MADDLCLGAIELACRSTWPNWLHLTAIQKIYWRQVMRTRLSQGFIEEFPEHPRVQINLNDLFSGRLGSYTTPIYTTDCWDKDPKEG